VIEILEGAMSPEDQADRGGAPAGAEDDGQPAARGPQADDVGRQEQEEGVEQPAQHTHHRAEPEHGRTRETGRLRRGGFATRRGLHRYPRGGAHAVVEDRQSEVRHERSRGREEDQDPGAVHRHVRCPV
jgi:hypothetical protein